MELPLLPSVPGPLVEADGVVPLEQLQMKIVKHTVHKVLGAAEDPPVYIVSTAKWFQLDLVLVDRRDLSLAVQNELTVDVQLTFEDGSPVPPPENGQALLECVHLLQVPFCRGRSSFKLKMGGRTLSSKYSNQNFRLLVAPVDEALRDQHRDLFAFTAPLKTVTKPHRKPTTVPKLSVEMDVPESEPRAQAGQAEEVRRLAAEVEWLKSELRGEEQARAEMQRTVRVLVDSLSRLSQPLKASEPLSPPADQGAALPDDGGTRADSPCGKRKRPLPSPHAPGLGQPPAEAPPARRSGRLATPTAGTA